jgi:hypothetical protein
MSNVDARILDWLKLDEEKDQISNAAFASLALGKVYARHDLFAAYKETN